MNNVKKTIENIILTLLTLAIALSGNTVILLIGTPVILVLSSKIVNLIAQNKIKDSIFSVSKKGKIFQNGLAHPLKMLELISKENKKEAFINESKKMFEQLPRTNKHDEVIKYTTVSHILTYKLLTELEKNGYVMNLKKESYKKKKLFFEKILIGNKQKINKKYQMYNISFSLTEKKFGQIDQQDKYIKIENNNEQKKETEETITKKIQELKELKNELIYNNVKENEDKKIR